MIRLLFTFSPLPPTFHSCLDPQMTTQWSKIEIKCKEKHKRLIHPDIIKIRTFNSTCLPFVSQGTVVLFSKCSSPLVSVAAFWSSGFLAEWFLPFSQLELVMARESAEICGETFTKTLPDASFLLMGGTNTLGTWATAVGRQVFGISDLRFFRNGGINTGALGSDGLLFW